MTVLEQIQTLIAEHFYLYKKYRAYDKITEVQLKFEPTPDWDHTYTTVPLEHNTEAYRMVQQKKREVWSKIVEVRLKLRELGVKI